MIERSAIRRFMADETGATAIEYALICGIMGAALISVAGTGGMLDAVYDTLERIIAALAGAGEAEEG